MGAACIPVKLHFFLRTLLLVRLLPSPPQIIRKLETLRSVLLLYEQN